MEEPLEFNGSIGKWPALVLMVGMACFAICVIAVADCAKASEIYRHSDPVKQAVEGK